MNRHNIRNTVVGLAIVAMTGFLAVQMVGGEEDKHSGHKHKAVTHASVGHKLDYKVQISHLGAALKALDTATKAVNSGDKKTALALA